ncbi:permease-like cell division protein FtsX [Thalassotalea ponticola]|uniref:permease-like cell division protein FtsX n=1 Tax=Thalassotalea ponticola TaxID=1523392 RepID=UPI0025B2FF74|nr:permease-like cell division protein FtsX [Thalassotalea ponticola]MDN3652466.1 permease-like cell division protein FtsX [Thalassotalea ponticola]
MSKESNSFRNRSSVSLSGLLMLPVRHLQQATASLGELWRTPLASVMTVLVLSISLTLPATLHLFTKNAQAVSSNWDSAAQISVFLKLDISDKDARNVANRIRLYPEVDSVKYISAEQALTEFKVLSGLGKALAYLDKNPLPATILVTPTERYSQPNAAKSLLQKINKQREVEQSKLDLEWLTRLEAIMSLVRNIVSALAILLCLSVVLIIGNTIRLSILNQKSAIAVMKMVGADDAFIRRPFMYTGFWYGVFGGVLAALTVTALAAYFDLAVANLAHLYDSQFSLKALTASETLTLIGSAILLGLLGSYISVRQHIREIEPSAE